MQGCIDFSDLTSRSLFSVSLFSFQQLYSKYMNTVYQYSFLLSVVLISDIPQSLQGRIQKYGLRGAKWWGLGWWGSGAVPQKSFLKIDCAGCNFSIFSCHCHLFQCLENDKNIFKIFSCPKIRGHTHLHFTTFTLK